MLRLIIADANAKRPPVLDLEDPNVRAWRGIDGKISCYGYALDGEHWMHLPRLASYCFTASSDVVTAFPDPATQPDLIREWFYRLVLPIALQALKENWEVLHASAVRMRQGVVAFCAFSQTGKSTIAYGLSQRGHALWADDNVLLETSDQCVRAVHLPTFKIRLRPASARFFGIDPTGERTTLERDSSHLIETPPAPLVALCVLKRELEASNTEVVSIRRLLSSQAFTAVLDHALCFSLHDIKRKRQMMRHYLDLVARIPVFEVRFQEGLDKLPIILDRIEQAIDSALRDPLSLSKKRKGKEHLNYSGTLAAQGLWRSP
jgi:hypothetical protein